MRTRIRLVVCLVMLLFLLCGCGEKTKRPVISGIVSVCNNPNCGKVIDGKLRMVFKNYPRFGRFNSLWDVIGGYKREDGITDFVLDWVRDSFNSSQPQENRIYLTSSQDFAVAGDFQIDSSKLCGKCEVMYNKYKIPLNSPAEVVNLMKTGFRSELDFKDAVAKQFGFSSYGSLSAHGSKGQRLEWACDVAYMEVKFSGLSLKDAVGVAKESYFSGMRHNADEEAGKRRAEEFFTKDREEFDNMTPAEFLDYMEKLSDDPRWKEAVRETRKAKGIK